jgi:release factor glutamine methyltransferase
MNTLIADNRVCTMRLYLRAELSALYDEREADNIANLLFGHFANWNRAEVVMHEKDRLSESEILNYHFALKRLKKNEPVQYVLGSTYFYGLEFKVNSHVLIPRPETEELVQLAIENCKKEKPNILDIGTGSGCIAIALKKNIAGSTVTALDISADALEVATTNAAANDVDINFLQANILDHTLGNEKFDMIVSNPPYVLSSDADYMSQHVLNFEPHTALFVPDHDALLFYNRIIELSKTNLAKGGGVLCEMHESKKNEMEQLLLSQHINNFQFYNDMQGKVRFLYFAL